MKYRIKILFTWNINVLLFYLFTFYVFIIIKNILKYVKMNLYLLFIIYIHVI